MDINEQNQGDYVLVHKSKAKISRARKGLIGFMVVGAIAAISGAGTFASFSASTDNDATFQTASMVLTNTVDAGTTCWSTNQDNATTPTTDANLDANNTECDAVLDANLVPGVSYTSVIKLGNEGNTAGTLKLFGDDGVCVDGANDTDGTNEVQRISITGGVSGDDFTVSFNGSAATADIAFDAIAGDLDTALEALTTLTGTNDVTVTKEGADFVITFSGGTFANNQVPQIVVDDTGMTGAAAAVASTTVEGLAAISAGSLVGTLCDEIELSVEKVANISGTGATTCVVGTGSGAGCTAPGAFADIPVFGSAFTLDAMNPAAEVFYKVTMRLPQNAPGTVAGCSGSSQFGTNGVGCDNPLMNGKADMSLRWQLQGA